LAVLTGFHTTLPRLPEFALLLENFTTNQHQLRRQLTGIYE
jgi:hypothetical protein